MVCSLHQDRVEGWLHKPQYQGSLQRCQPVGYLAGDLTSLRCWVLAQLTLGPLWGSVPRHPLSTTPFAFPHLGPPWPLRGFWAWLHAPGNFPGPLSVQSSASPQSRPGSDGVPGSEFPEVALGQQASAPWQWLPGSTRLALAVTLAKAGASQGCEDDLQDVTEKGRVTRGSPSGNPVSVLQNK